jgi:hypothetical protein
MYLKFLVLFGLLQIKADIPKLLCCGFISTVSVFSFLHLPKPLVISLKPAQHASNTNFDCSSRRQVEHVGWGNGSGSHRLQMGITCNTMLSNPEFLICVPRGAL